MRLDFPGCPMLRMVQRRQYFRQAPVDLEILTHLSHPEVQKFRRVLQGRMVLVVLGPLEHRLVLKDPIVPPDHLGLLVRLVLHLLEDQVVPRTREIQRRLSFLMVRLVRSDQKVREVLVVRQDQLVPLILLNQVQQ